MGVLDPLKETTSEMQELNDDYSKMLELTVENLGSYAGVILNNRVEMMEEEDPFFFLIWRDKDVMDINSREEIQEELKAARMLKEDIFIEGLKNSYAETYTEQLDIEPDHDNPIESYSELDSVSRKLDNLIDTVDQKLINDHDVNPELVKKELDIVEYNIVEAFYCLTDSIDALPLIEGIVDSKENISSEKEDLLDKALEEHENHKNSVNQQYNRTEFPDEPVEWEEIIEEENLRDYMYVSDIATATHGDSLHIMMEELCENGDRVQPEYPLHFLNKGDRLDTPNGNRIDNTVRPDAVDDLFVYEFKHMPREQRDFLDQNGKLEENEKFIDAVRQMNGYLNELDLPVGMLVYVSSDMDIQEYVIEKHPVENWNNYQDEFNRKFIHEREKYDFENIVRNL